VVVKTGKKDYISIKEFAARAGVSNQAVYQRLDKNLKKFVKVVENRKYIDIAALDEYSIKQVDQDVEKTDKQNEDLNKQLINSIKGDKVDETGNKPESLENMLVNTLQDALKALTAQLEVKDRQISELNERLREAQELNRNNQILLGSEQSRTNPVLLAGAGGGKDGVAPDEDDDKRRNEKKRGFWGLFRKGD